MDKQIDISMEFQETGHVHVSMNIFIDGEESNYLTLHADADHAFAEVKRTMRLHGFPFPSRDPNATPAPGATVHHLGPSYE